MENAPNDNNFQAAQRVEIDDFTSLWQKTLQECISDVDELFELLNLPIHLKAGAKSASQLFPLKVPRRYLSLIEKANPDDPLLRQILPLNEEHSTAAHGFSSDPLQEISLMQSPGVIQKYQKRLLLTLTGACAVHCRYCFRRQFPYSEANPTNKHWKASIEQIKIDTTLSEIILSGGDPLLINDAKLERIINDLGVIKHLKTLRIHTRVLSFLPERITPKLIHLLQSTRLKVVVVIHCNHPREIDDIVIKKLAALKNTGITLLNQSVLLRGVNDQAEILATLSERLFEAGVLPYYLHLLDKVNGTSHFDLTLEQVNRIYQQLLTLLPGYLVPKLVREIPGQASKTPILPFSSETPAKQICPA